MSVNAPTLSGPVRSQRPRQGVGVGHIIFGGLLVLLGIGWLLEVTGTVRLAWDTLLAAGLIIIGVALVAGARDGHHGGLVFLGIVATVMLAVASFTNIRLEGGFGERVTAPRTTAELERTYHLAAGALTVDLSRVELPAGTTDIEAGVGTGELVVRVPAGAGLRVTARAGTGEIVVDGRSQSGANIETTYTSSNYDTAPARLNLDLNVGFGQVRVQR